VFALMVGFFQQGMGDFINGGSKPHSRLTTKELLDKASAPLTVPPEYAFFDGDSFGFHNVGRLYSKKENVVSLFALRSAFGEILRPGETYLDLTGRQANYFYLGMPVPTPYGSPWLAANAVLQRDLIVQIKQNLPPVVWMGPTLAQEGDIPALRTYELYRFLLTNYLPISRNGCVFLVARDRFNTVANNQPPDIRSIRDLVAHKGLGSVPAAWGRSWEQLRFRFAVVEELNNGGARILSTEPLGIETRKPDLTGRDCDFLRFNFWSSSTDEKLELNVTWTSEYGPGVAHFTAENGTNLIPLGAFPDWLLAREIHDVRICPVVSAENSKSLVNNIAFLRLKD
jgi:hypothetical protein